MIYFILCGYILVSYWMPWWSVPFIGLSIGLFTQTWMQTILLSFVPYFIFWATLAYHSDNISNKLIGEKMTELFKLPSPWYLYAFTGFLGAVLCLSGAQLGYRIKLSLNHTPKNLMN